MGRGSKTGEVPLPAGLGPAGLVLRGDPGPVLGGGTQVGEELLAGPVVSSFLGRSDCEAPDVTNINLCLWFSFRTF